MSFADSWYRASCALLLLTLNFSMFSFYLPLSFSLSLLLSLSLSLSFSLSLYLSPSFSLWLQDTCHLMPYQIFSSWSILLFHTISFHSSYKIHQLFTDYLLRLPSSELLETSFSLSGQPSSSLSLRLVLCLFFSGWLSFWLSCPSWGPAGDRLGRLLCFCYIGQGVPSCPQMGCVGTLGLTKGFSTMTFIFFFFRVYLVLLLLCDTKVTKVHESRELSWEPPTGGILKVHPPSLTTLLEGFLPWIRLAAPVCP